MFLLKILLECGWNFQFDGVLVGDFLIWEGDEHWPASHCTGRW